MEPSITCFEASVLSIVLTLAGGPNASLLCGTWCDPHAAAASGCHYEDPAISPSMAGDDCCDHVVLNVAAFLQEDHAIPVPRYRLAHSTTDARPGNDTAREWSLEKRPLSTALRL